MANLWLVRTGTKTVGPIPTSELKRLASSGELRPTDLIQQHGATAWVAAAKVKGLFPPVAAPAVEPLSLDEAPPDVVPLSLDDAADELPTAAVRSLRKVWIGAGAALALAGAVAGVVVVGTGGSRPDSDESVAAAAAPPQPAPGDEPADNAGKTDPELTNPVAESKTTSTPKAGKKGPPTKGGTKTAPKGGATAPAPVTSRPAPAPAAAAGPEDAWKVLTLVSLEYELNGQPRPRDHSLPPYLPLLASRNAGARQVAALSARWEIDVWELQRAHQRRVGSVENLLGFATPRPAGAKPDPTPPPVPAELKAALAEAKRSGLLAPYQTANAMLVSAEAGDSISQASQASAEYYYVQLVIARMQSILFDRAEALAKSTANGNNSRGDDLEVKGVFDQGKKWGTVIVRNRSASDVEHVTFAVTAPTKALPPGSPALDRALGAGVVGTKEAGENLAGAVANDRMVRELPVRVFVHVPKLAAGAECEVRVFRSSMEFAKTHSASYSLWASGVAVEGKPLPGYDAAAESMQARAAEAKQPLPKLGTAPTVAPADSSDLFAKGSVWRGTSVFTQTGLPAPVQRKVELVITERSGDAFKGKILYDGAKVPANVEGSTADGTVKWETVTNGKSGLPHAGPMKGRRVVLKYEGTGDGNKAQKATVTLDYVPPGKK